MTECRIAEKLTELRNAKGVTQDEVAAALSVSNKTVSKWENGMSSPDLNMLAALSEYYNVTTDVLLGLDSGEKSTRQMLSAEFRGLNRGEAALKTFEIMMELFPAGFDCQARETDGGDYIPHLNGRGTRNQISSSEMYTFAACSDDVNIAIAHLPNKADFAWLWDDEKRKNIASLFQMLGDSDALKILGFIHSKACSTCFTAEYMAKNTGIPLEKTREILDTVCGWNGICVKRTAHLKNGDAEVYESYGDSILFAMIALAYERIHGRNFYNYNSNGDYKMIKGGERK